MRSIAPAQICTADFPLNTPFPVHIFRHTGQWIDGKAMQIRRDAPTLIVNVPRGIEGDTFGGPVITTAGRYSASSPGPVAPTRSRQTTRAPSQRTPTRSGQIPHLTVPPWLLRRMAWRLYGRGR